MFPIYFSILFSNGGDFKKLNREQQKETIRNSKIISYLIIIFGFVLLADFFIEKESMFILPSIILIPFGLFILNRVSKLTSS